jgi:hypothetical protein
MVHQRCTVGTLFKQSPFEAKKLGAALVATNLGAIINEHFLASPKNMKASSLFLYTHKAS